MLGFGPDKGRRVARIAFLVSLAAVGFGIGAFFVAWWRFMRDEQEWARVNNQTQARYQLKAVAVRLMYPDSADKLEWDGFTELSPRPGMRVFAHADGLGAAGPRFVTVVRVPTATAGSAWEASLFDRTERLGWRVGPDTFRKPAEVAYDHRNDLCGADAVLQEYLSQARPRP